MFGPDLLIVAFENPQPLTASPWSVKLTGEIPVRGGGKSAAATPDEAAVGDMAGASPAPTRGPRRKATTPNTPARAPLPVLSMPPAPPPPLPTWRGAVLLEWVGPPNPAQRIALSPGR